MGSLGVVVDGTHYLPNARSGEPCIVPLLNQTTFTIHNKIFRFDYPAVQPRAQAPSVGFKTCFSPYPR